MELNAGRQKSSLSTGSFVSPIVLSLPLVTTSIQNNLLSDKSKRNRAFMLLTVEFSATDKFISYQTLLCTLLKKIVLSLHLPGLLRRKP